MGEPFAWGRDPEVRSTTHTIPSKRKIRESCDDCSLAKVKCTKERPTCIRCTNLGLLCNYSPSMRIGKPHASRRPTSTQSTTAIANSAKDVNRQRSSAPSRPGPDRNNTFSHEIKAATVPAYNNSSWGYTDRPHTSPPARRTQSEDIRHNSTQFPWNEQGTRSEGNNHCFQNSDPFQSEIIAQTFSTSLEAILDSPFGSSNSSDILGQWNPIQLEPSPFYQPVAEHDCGAPIPRNGDSSDSLEASSSRGSSTGSSSNLPKEEHQCLGMALSTLHNLNFSSGNLRSSTASSLISSPLTIDQALSLNRSAVQNILMIQECPFAHDSHFPFILAIAISKVLSWYQAIARISTSAAQCSTSGSVPTEHVMQTPIILGSYKLDDEDDQKIKSQIVLGELKKVENLIVTFVEKYCRGNNGQNNTNAGFSMALETFLRTRLHESFNQATRADASSTSTICMAF